jgi:hypothetical protein
VLKIKYLLLIVISVFVITACGSKNPTPTPGVTVVVQTPAEPAYPNPVQETVPIVSSEYPGPLGGNGVPEVIATPDYFVTQLTVPTPESGKATITGLLLVGGEGGDPYMATLYLASTLPASTPDYPPMIAFSEKKDQRAIQDVDTGQFLFTDVTPGVYAIIVWTPFGGNPLLDKSGGTLILTIKSDEIKDLGIIPID